MSSPETPLTPAAVTEALRPVQDPELHRSIVELGMVRDVVVDGTRVSLTVVLTIPGCPLKGEITSRVNSALAELGVHRHRPHLGRHDRRGARRPARAPARRSVLDRRLATRTRPCRGSGHPVRRSLLEDPGAAHRLGQGWCRQVVGPPPTSPSPSPIVASASPSSTPTCGASPSRRCWASTAPPVLIDQMIVPPEVHGVSVISMGFFAEEDQAVIWRGPMLHKALEQFLTDVYWDEPDYLLVDLPPGTGDISISLAQFPAPRRVVRRDDAAAGGAAGRPARRLDGQEGQPAGSRRPSRT